MRHFPGGPRDEKIEREHFMKYQNELYGLYEAGKNPVLTDPDEDDEPIPTLAARSATLTPKDTPSRDESGDTDDDDEQGNEVDGSDDNNQSEAEADSDKTVSFIYFHVYIYKFYTYFQLTMYIFYSEIISMKFLDCR